MSFDFEEQIRSDTLAFNTHKDSFLLRTALQTTIGTYPSLTMREASDMRMKMLEMFSTIFKGGYYMPNDATELPDREFLTIMLEEISHNPKLQDIPGVALGIATLDLLTADEEKYFNDQGRLENFDSLIKFPAYYSGLQDFVATALSAYQDKFLTICEQINNTPFLSLLGPQDAKNYANIMYDMYEGDRIEAALKLHALPAVWTLMEPEYCKKGWFFAYTPDVPLENLPDENTGLGEYFYLEYSREHHFIAIDYSEHTSYIDRGTAPNSNWVNNRVDDPDKLPGIYILFKHALGVIDGKRAGETAKDNGWVKDQIKYLRPFLASDVAALEQAMTSHGISWPTVPPATLPASSQSSVWAAHKSFFRGP